MHAGFFYTGVADGTVVIIKVHVFSSQQVSGVQSVFNEQPKEKFMLSTVAASPHPGEEGRGFLCTLKKFVSLLWRERC